LIADKTTCFIVAEISANHGQSFKRAVTLIKKAKECGADAVKFQAYTPDTLTINADNRYFRIKHPRWGGQTLYALYKKAYTPWKWFAELKKIANGLGLVFFSTAYDKTSVDFLEKLRVPFHKIASFELVDLGLIEYAAKTKKPLIISTGMGTLPEIKEAVNAARNAGAANITLLKCVSSYPAKPNEMNIKTIPHMRKVFNLPVGLSDHTLGTVVSVAAVSLGAAVIEKHLCLSRKIETPDSSFSAEPEELKRMVRDIRIAEKAVGKIRYGLTEKEKKMYAFRRSLFAEKDIKKGDTFTEANTRSVRPANGLKPKYLRTILGKKTKKDIKKGTPITFNLVQGGKNAVL